jgi:hypothetical protein
MESSAPIVLPSTSPFLQGATLQLGGFPVDDSLFIRPFTREEIAALCTTNKENTNPYNPAQEREMLPIASAPLLEEPPPALSRTLSG